MKWHNSLKLSFTIIQGLCLNFVECETFLQSNCPDILALCETSLDETTDSCNFSLRGSFPLIQKDSITHMHGLAVFLKEKTSFCTGLISKKLCGCLLLFSTGFTSLSVLLLSPLLITFLVYKHSFLILFHLM